VAEYIASYVLREESNVLLAIAKFAGSHLSTGKGITVSSAHGNATVVKYTVKVIPTGRVDGLP